MFWKNILTISDLGLHHYNPETKILPICDSLVLDSRRNSRIKNRQYMLWPWCFDDYFRKYERLIQNMMLISLGRMKETFMGKGK